MKRTSLESRASLTIATLALAAVNLSAATLLVSLESTNPVAPFAAWATAATNIQDAVDASHDGDTVLVTNGVYAAGGRSNTELDYWGNQIEAWSRVVVTNSIRLESVNGPLLTTIEGSQLFDNHHRITNDVRCVLLGTKSLLSGFTLQYGYAENGGGVYCLSTNSLLTNCVLVANWAGGYGSGKGGGAYGGTLYSCQIVSNSAAVYGGGAFRSILHDCTLNNNSVWRKWHP